VKGLYPRIQTPHPALPARKPSYFVRIAPHIALGYRRNASGFGTWRRAVSDGGGSVSTYSQRLAEGGTECSSRRAVGKAIFGDDRDRDPRDHAASDGVATDFREVGAPVNLELSGRICLLEAGNIVGGLDPFFAKAASGAEIPCYLDGSKDGRSDDDVVSGTKGTTLARDSNDVGGSTLWARLGILHGDPRQRGCPMYLPKLPRG
jgi:hypothetical protein